MSLKETFQARTALGCFSKTTDSAFVEACGYAGLDFIIIDMEHGPVSYETVHNHVRAAKLGGVHSIIRAKSNDEHSIGSALDSGADGVQVPNVNTVAQAKQAVSAAKFHPKGSRGVCRFVRAAKFGTQDKSDYFSLANEKLLILQVEGVEGVNNLEEILAIPGIDVLFIGPYDLSQSVGKPGEVDAPEVTELMQKIAEQAKAADVALGTFCDSLENLKKFKQQGFDYIAYSVDVNIFTEACKFIFTSNRC